MNKKKRYESLPVFRLSQDFCDLFVQLHAILMQNENANNEAAFGNNQQDGDKVNGGQHSDNSQPDSTTETEIENQDTVRIYNVLLL